MLRKFISYLIIFSLFYADVANAVKSGSPPARDDIDVKARSHHSSLRRIKSSGDLNKSQGPVQKISPLKISPLSTDSGHSSDSPPKGSPLTSSTGSEKKSDDEGTKSVGSSEEHPGNSPLQEGTLLSRVPSDEMTQKGSSETSTTSSLKQEERESEDDDEKTISFEGEWLVLPKGSIQGNNDGYSDFDVDNGSFKQVPGSKRGSILQTFEDLFTSSGGEKKENGGTSVRQEDESIIPPNSLRQNGVSSQRSSMILPLSINRGPSDLIGSEHSEKTPLLGKNSGTGGNRKVSVRYSNGGEDLEKGTLISVPVLPEDLDPRVLAFLLYAKNYINDGKITLRQGLLGGILGTLIGVGVGDGMPAVFFAGLNGLGPQFHYEMEWGNMGLAYLLLYHTTITLGVDSISRNVMTIGNLASPSLEEFSLSPKKIKYGKVEIDPRKGALVLVYMGAGLAALLPVYYLWSVEKNLAEKYPSQTASFYTFFGYLSPSLFLDALFSNGQALKDLVDQKFNEHLISQAFSQDHLLSARNLRTQELDRFTDLERFFRRTSDDEIHDLYEQVLTKGFQIDKKGIDIPEETVKATDALRTLGVLRKIHQDGQIPDEVEENWKKRTAHILGWGIPGAATVGRSLVFYTIISSLLGDLSLANGPANITLSVILGGIIASLFQGKVEMDTVKAGTYDLLFGEETDGDTSQNCLWKGLRKVGKGYNYAQGAWNTLPYLFVGVAATAEWPIALQVMTLVFFGIADMFNNTLSFHESYGNIIKGGESLLSYKYRTPGYKRNKLIRLVQRYKKTYETMDPNVLMKIDALLGSNHGNTIHTES